MIYFSRSTIDSYRIFHFCGVRSLYFNGNFLNEVIELSLIPSICYYDDNLCNCFILELPFTSSAFLTVVAFILLPYI